MFGKSLTFPLSPIPIPITLGDAIRRVQPSRLARQERRKVLDDEEGAECVDAKRGKRFSGIDLRGGFLRMENAGDAEGETEMVRGRGKEVFGSCGRGGDASFVLKAERSGLVWQAFLVCVIYCAECRMRS